MTSPVGGLSGDAASSPAAAGMCFSASDSFSSTGMSSSGPGSSAATSAAARVVSKLVLLGYWCH